MKERKALIVWILFCTYLFSQTELVTKIEFIGQTITKDYIISREIHHPLNVPLDTTIIIEDKNRLENLGIFSYVDWITLPTNGDGITLRYYVIESWRYLPGLTPLYEEEFGWSVGVGLLINNFRGRNESLSIDGQFGERVNYGINYLNPWIFGDHISFEMGIGRDNEDHPFLPYEKLSYNVQMKFGRYFFDNIFKTKIGIKWEITDYEKKNEDEHLELNYLRPALYVLFDTRDIYVMPTRGVLFRHSVEGFKSLDKDYNDWIQWFQSYSYFRKIIPGNLPLIGAINLTGFLSYGSPDETSISYIGGAFTVRGFESPVQKIYANSKYNYRFGYHALYGTLELRQILIPKFVAALRNEFGVSASAFVDIGVIGRDKQDLFEQTPMIGAGIGLQFLWPIVQLVRLDYGWAFRDGQSIGNTLHIGFGQKF